MDVSIVIPAFNEERRIRNILQSVSAFLDNPAANSPKSAEIIVVADGCSDGTEAEVRAAAQADPRIRCISYAENRGKGYALRTGVAASSGNAVLFMDADESTSLEALPRFLMALADGADLVIGSRRTRDAVITGKQPMLRQFVGHVCSLTTRLVLGLPFKDTQCGFKAFRGEVARRLFAEAKLDRFAIDIEILSRARRQNLKIIEMGVQWKDAPGSSVRALQDGVRVFTDIIAIRRQGNREMKTEENRGGGDLRLIKWLFVAVVLLKLALFWLVPVTDSTESRYAAIARDMARSGDYVTPRVWINGEQIPYLGKPPLHFWMMSISFSLFGENEFAARFPSFLSAALLLFILYHVGRRFYDERIAWLALLISATSLTFFALSSGVIIDMTLALCIAGALLFQFAVLRETDRRIAGRYSLLVFLLLALGFLAKGPIALVLFGLPTFVWIAINGEWESLAKHRWVSGITLFVIMAVPWFIVAEQANPGFLTYFFVNENFLRFVTPNYGDLYGSGRLFPYGSSILFFLAGCMPWTLWLVYIAISRTARDRFRKQWRESGFHFLGFVLIVLFLALARQSLWTYILPAIPLFALWLANGIAGEKKQSDSVKYIGIAVAVIYSALILLTLPTVNENSTTKSIRDDLQRMFPRGLQPKSVVFAPFIPYSGYYYFDAAIRSYDEKDWQRNVNRMLAQGVGRFYIIEAKNLPQIDAGHLARLTFVEQWGKWRVYSRPQAAPRSRKGRH